MVVMIVLFVHAQNTQIERDREAWREKEQRCGYMHALQTLGKQTRQRLRQPAGIPRLENTDEDHFILNPAPQHKA